MGLSVKQLNDMGSGKPSWLGGGGGSGLSVGEIILRALFIIWVVFCAGVGGAVGVGMAWADCGWFGCTVAAIVGAPIGVIAGLVMLCASPTTRTVWVKLEIKD